MSERRTPLPPWIRRRLGAGAQYLETERYLHTLGIDTICSEARCPNQGECWARGTATVLILGRTCTRNCPFCSVVHGKPEPPDRGEPERVALFTQKLGIQYLVITSVNRDDLPDGGAAQFRDVVAACRRINQDMRFELLVPDFMGIQQHALDILSEAFPFVFCHNVETVPRLYKQVRPGSSYQRSLNLLKKAKQQYPDLPVKSSLMLGLGERESEVFQVLHDLRDAGCERICIGQYLKPSKDSLDVAAFVTPERFSWWADQALAIGFSWVISEPFARSSYHAELTGSRGCT